jgi:hypothetical protein
MFSYPQKIWKRIKTEASGPKFSISDRKSFVVVQPIFFGTKSSKTNAFDLERTLV